MQSTSLSPSAEGPAGSPVRSIDLGLGLPVVVGLHWHLAKDAKEARARLKGFARKVYGRVVNEAGEVALGEVQGDGPTPGQAYCGAALVAAGAPAAFVFHELPADDGTAAEVWICGVFDGVPAYGFEAILPVREARAKYTEFVSICPSVRIIGSLNDAAETLEGLLARVDKKRRAVALMQRSGIRPKTVGAVVMLAALLGLAGLWYERLEEVSQREKLSLRQAIRREVSTKDEAQRVAALRERFEAEVAARAAEVQRQPDAVAIVDAWLATITHEVPFSRNGWQPVRARCVAASCEVTWRPGPASLPVHVVGLPGRPQQGQTGEPVTAFDVGPVEATAKLVLAEDFGLALLSFGKLARANVDLRGEPKPVVVTPTADQRAVGMLPRTVGTAAGYSAAFSNVLALREFAKWIRPYAVTIDSLEVVAFVPGPGSPSFTIEGRYMLAAAQARPAASAGAVIARTAGSDARR